MNFIAPARALIAAQESGHDMATLCAVCFHVLKRSDSYLRTHPEAADRLNAFVTEGDYDGRVHVRHLLGVVRDDVGWEAVRSRVAAPRTRDPGGAVLRLPAASSTGRDGVRSG